MKTNKNYWSFVIFVGKDPLMYYPYKFNTKALAKATARIMCDLLQGNRICVYDSRHYPDLFDDLKPYPNASV